MQMKTIIETDNTKNWSDIDWKIVNKSVKKLRRRIFDAKKRMNNRKLRSLQKLMLKSKANILFAIRKVSYNSGKKTAGIDGETLNSPMDRIRLYKNISKDGWDALDPKPIRRIYIKEIDKLRPIGIPTIYDRVIQVMICNSLEPEWEAIFEKGSYGFRPKRNINDAVSRIWLSLNKEGSKKWIVDSDITKCFDPISHDYMLKCLKFFPGFNYIKKFLESGIIVRNVWMDSDEEGIPQGSPLSPLLCNIALHGLESEVGVMYTKNGYISQKGRTLIRFADDLVILCYTKNDAELALETLKLSLLKRGLQISELKTKIVHVSEGFDFLGFNIKMYPKIHVSKNKSILKVDEENYKVIYKNVGIYVSPSRKSIKKVKTKLKDAMISSKGSSAIKFVGKLNQIIKGYIQSKYHWHSNKAFREIDHYVYKLCWRWAIRRHPNKGVKWIKRRYFKHVRLGNINNRWVFSALKNKRSNPLLYNNLYVYKTYWFPIRDYLVAKMDKLPDNRLDEQYFKDLEKRRLLSKDFNIFRKLDKDIVISQEGICPICDNDLFNGENLYLHHIIPVKDDGKTVFSNLVYLHMACHYKIHNSKEQMAYTSYLQGYRTSHPRLNYKKLRERDNLDNNTNE